MTVEKAQDKICSFGERRVQSLLFLMVLVHRDTLPEPCAKMAHVACHPGEVEGLDAPRYSQPAEKAVENRRTMEI